MFFEKKLDKVLKPPHIKITAPPRVREQMCIHHLGHKMGGMQCLATPAANTFYVACENKNQKRDGAKNCKIPGIGKCGILWRQKEKVYGRARFAGNDGVYSWDVLGMVWLPSLPC